MRILRFQKLSIRNFMSFGDEPITIDFTTGLHLITGYNKDCPESKNGIGKSTICDALVFALFGDTIKPLNKDELINDVNKKNCEICLDFTIEKNGKTTTYNIKRGIAPSICEFTIDSIPTTKSSIPIVTKHIEDHLGIGKKLFQQSIIMSVGNSSSFFSLKKNEKREFIEGVFDLDIFSDMLSEAKTGFTNSKNERDTIDLKLKSEEGNLSLLQDKDKTFDDTKNTAIKELTEKNKELADSIVALNRTLGLVPSSESLLVEKKGVLDQINKMDEVLGSARVKCSGLDKDIKNIQNEIRVLESIGDICTKCNRPLDVDEVKQRVIEISDKRNSIPAIQNTINKINEQIELVKKKKEELNTKKEAISTKISSINTVLEKNKAITAHVTSIEKTIKDNEVKIQAKTNEVSVFADMISKSSEKITKFKTELDTARKEYTIFELCKFILSEEGVKSVIINDLKEFLNTRLNVYLSELDTPVVCMFDEYFEETIFNKFGVKKSYHSLSGGEKRRIDLAVLFTLQDMLKNRSGTDIQLSFYDEILDTSIDESGRKKVLEVLKKKSKDSAIYVISHRPKMSELIDSEIVLEKHNDFTTIKGEYK